jgi:hypothetical protein
MKDFITLGTDVSNNADLKKLAENILNEIFTESQENLVKNMPWGDEDHPNSEGKKDSTISDTSLILISGVPPYWIDGNKIELRYDAPHSFWVEYGTPPHPVSGKKLIAWAERKLHKNQKEAKQIAYATATKIKKEGMLPHPFLRPAMEKIIKKYNLKTLS